MTLTTDFGFFSPKVLEDQRGLATTDEERARRDEVSPTPPMSLLEGGGALAHLPAMASGRLRMIDEVTGFWPDAGDAGLGRIRTYQTITREPGTSRLTSTKTRSSLGRSGSRPWCKRRAR